MHVVRPIYSSRLSPALCLGPFRWNESTIAIYQAGRAEQFHEEDTRFGTKKNALVVEHLIYPSLPRGSYLAEKSKKAFTENLLTNSPAEDQTSESSTSRHIATVRSIRPRIDCRNIPPRVGTGTTVFPLACLTFSFMPGHVCSCNLYLI